MENQLGIFDDMRTFGLHFGKALNNKGLLSFKQDKNQFQLKLSYDSIQNEFELEGNLDFELKQKNIHVSIFNTFDDIAMSYQKATIRSMPSLNSSSTTSNLSPSQNQAPSSSSSSTNDQSLSKISTKAKKRKIDAGVSLFCKRYMYIIFHNCYLFMLFLLFIYAYVLTTTCYVDFTMIEKQF